MNKKIKHIEDEEFNDEKNANANKKRKQKIFKKQKNKDNYLKL